MAPEGKFCGGNRWTIFHFFFTPRNWIYRFVQFSGIMGGYFSSSTAPSRFFHWFAAWNELKELFGHLTLQTVEVPPVGLDVLKVDKLSISPRLFAILADEIFPVDWNKFVRPRGNCVYVNGSGRKETWWQVIWPTCDWWPITGRVIKNRFAPSNDSDIEASTLAQQAGRRGRNFKMICFILGTQSIS